MPLLYAVVSAHPKSTINCSPQSKMLIHAIATWDLWKFKTLILSSLNILLIFFCSFTPNSEHNAPTSSAKSQGPNGFSISFWHLQAILNQWCCVLQSLSPQRLQHFPHLVINWPMTVTVTLWWQTQAYWKLIYWASQLWRNLKVRPSKLY